MTPHSQYFFFFFWTLEWTRRPLGAILSVCETPALSLGLENVTGVYMDNVVCSKWVKFKFQGELAFFFFKSNSVSLPPTDQFPDFHPHHQNSGVKASSAPNEIHRLQIQVSSSFCLCSLSPFMQHSALFCWFPLLASLPPSQVGQVDPDPHPPAGYSPGGFYLLDGWVHQSNHQSASHQALHWSLLLLLSGWKKAPAIIFNILTTFGGGGEAQHHHDSRVCAC